MPGRPTLALVRLPRETLRSRAGDCDDLAVLYAALLQNLGIDTALVDVLDHVFVMFDTGLTARSVAQIARDPGLLHVDGRGRVWVPVETTLVGQPKPRYSINPKTHSFLLRKGEEHEENS